MAFALGPLLVRAISDESAPRALVEDDALLAILLAELLAGMGHDICATAATEAEAVIAATRHDPDLMIVDEGLARGGSGVSAVEEIFRAGPLAHVFISGDAEKVQRRSRTRWLSANHSGKLNSPELST
jgi:CheY-like chemotaxis protein